MSNRPTPETDSEHLQFAMGGFTLDFCRKLERERDEAREELRTAVQERHDFHWELLDAVRERNEAREQENIHHDNFLFLQREAFEMREAIIATLEENRHLADGDDCTLAKLKSVVPKWK